MVLYAYENNIENFIPLYQEIFSWQCETKFPDPLPLCQSIASNVLNFSNFRFIQFVMLNKIYPSGTKRLISPMHKSRAFTYFGNRNILMVLEDLH